MTIYEQLEAASHHVIKAYHADLTTHDRNSIEANPGIPFLHWARECGSHFTHLFPADDPRWPAKGEMKPFLFSRADRETFLDACVEIAKYATRENQALITHYFDGVRLHKTNPNRALEIAREHVSRVRTEWYRKPESAIYGGRSWGDSIKHPTGKTTPTAITENAREVVVA